MYYCRFSFYLFKIHAKIILFNKTYIKSGIRRDIENGEFERKFPPSAARDYLMASFSPNSSIEDKQQAYRDFMAARRGDVTSKDLSSETVPVNQQRQYKTYADLAHEAQMGTRAPINHHNPG